MSLRLNPYLIPRFNIDYSLYDLFVALTSITKSSDFSHLMAIFEGCYMGWSNSGRTCLYTILKCLNLPDNSNIGIPLYTCPSDFDAIIKAGHKPVFLDINLENLTLCPNDLRKKIGSIDALVVVHTFGRPADMDEILSIAGENPVIEDCAHSLLSKYKNMQTGTIATAGFFSFRSGKYISAGEGGLIITKDKKLAERINLEISSYPTPSLENEVCHTIITYFRSTLYHRPWYGLFSLPFGQLLENKVDLMNKYSFTISHIRKSNLKVILNHIRSFHSKVDINRANSLLMIKKLKNTGIWLPKEINDTYSNYFLFPVLFQNEYLRNLAFNKLCDIGVDTAKMFSLTPCISKQNYEYIGDCPTAEFVSKRILILPNYYTLKKKQLDRIVDCLNKEEFYV